MLKGLKTFILTLLVFLSLVALFLRFGYQPLIEYFNLTPKAGIRVEANQKALVFINQKQVGETPFIEEKLEVGEYLVTVKPTQTATSSSEYNWEGYVKLNVGALTVVNRELGSSKASSSGEIISLEKGNGATIISTPPGAIVFIDGKEVGRTPISLSTLGVGEHLFLLSKENFLKRSIRATVVEKYNLTLNVDLAISEADLTKIPTVPVTSITKLIVKNTPTGFLRVRSKPSTNSEEVGRVNPGEELDLIEELPNWIKIRLPNGTEGYVSSTYIEKKNQ